MAFSSRHYRLVSPPADTAEDIRQRLIRRAASERGMADRVERFPVLTSFNAEEASRFQQERIEHHTRLMGGQL